MIFEVIRSENPFTKFRFVGLYQNHGIEVINRYLLWVHLLGGKTEHSFTEHFGMFLSYFSPFNDFISHGIYLT